MLSSVSASLDSYLDGAMSVSMECILLGGLLAGACVLHLDGSMLYMRSRRWMGERCHFAHQHAQMQTGLYSRCDTGRDASHIAALWQTLCISSSVSGRLVCASMMSVAVVHSAPEMAVMAIHCTDSSCFGTLTDLVALVPHVACITGAYHTSAT